jgi:hypothetical protein
VSPLCQRLEEALPKAHVDGAACGLVRNVFSAEHDTSVHSSSPTSYGQHEMSPESF